MPDYVIDSWSEGIIEQTDWNEMRKTRQEAYHKWQGFALNNNLDPVFSELHLEANPWCFPAYTKSKDESAYWYKWGWKNNKLQK